jgi:hypothetical protein
MVGMNEEEEKIVSDFAMIDAFSDEVTSFVAKAIRTAFQRGVSAGRVMASADTEARINEARHKINSLMESLTTLKGLTTTLNKRMDDVEGIASQEPSRAPLGSVKPRLLELISRPQGASTGEMETIGVKHNSIRGTIYALHKAELIEKRGDRWFRKIEAPADAGTSQ